MSEARAKLRYALNLVRVPDLRGPPGATRLMEPLMHEHHGQPPTCKLCGHQIHDQDYPDPNPAPCPGTYR